MGLNQAQRKLHFSKHKKYLNVSNRMCPLEAEALAVTEIISSFGCDRDTYNEIIQEQ
jgi:hypothetical protein